MSHPSKRTAAPPPCLPWDIKDLLKEDVRLWLFGFLMGKAFGFWMKGDFFMWEALEGKRIAEGKKNC
jgi:hypothetical protein